MGETEDERTAQASQLFENFFQTSTCKGTLQAFSILCRQLGLDPLDHGNFYSSLKAAVSSWKVKALWTKLDKRAQQKVYNQNKACQGTRCLIIGGGPCGLRTAIELALLGCKVVVIEKRDTFSRNNVLHLWPYTIHDLRALGAKKFYGKFCAGAIDHISIRQLQLMLLKVCLILGVEFHVNVEFVKLLEPPEQQTEDGPGWRAELRPSNHPVSDYDFDVVIGADGRRSTLDGFSRKEFRGKLAIAITANFVNRNTTAEAKVEEISGVAFIFNQKFFLELKEETGIDLENIVYYKDNTHYFVMTAKKQSLLDKGVIINDYIETERLLNSENVNQEALLSYAREAADFGTNYQLPSLDYAINHYGQPDVAMFDFTCMYASENAALIREKHGHQLVVTLVGDSLLEPFWPMGTGCARGFLAAFDTAWMVRGWAQGKNALEILAERESIYRLLPQTTPENISKNFEQYTIDPATRYPNLNSSCVRPHQVRHLFIDGHSGPVEKGGLSQRPVNLSRKESEVRPGRLLTWCQNQTQGYRGVDVTNLTSSWRSGLALCALIHRHRPELIDFDSLNEEDVAGNNQLAFDVAEREFSIQPVTTGKEMAARAEPDKLLMVLYLSRFFEAFRKSSLNKHVSKEPVENGKEYPPKTNHRLQNLTQPRKRIPGDEKKAEDDSVNKRRRKGSSYLAELSCHSAPPAVEDGELRENKVRSMATQLLAKFEENSTTVHAKSGEPSSPSFSPPLSRSTTPTSSDEEEEEEEEENPRFAKPKAIPPLSPLPPSRSKWQPSVYLRLLENPGSVSQQTSFLSSNDSCINQSSHSCYPSSPHSLSPVNAPGSELYHTESTHPDSPTRLYSGSDLSAPEAEPSSDACLQKSKNQRLSTREFSRRSIKERAALLSTMFHGSNKSPAPLSLSQVESSTSSFLSTPSPPPPPPPHPPLSPSESSATFPVVHPVPEPTAQTCFSAIPPNTSEPKEPFSSLSSSESENNEQSSPSHPDCVTSSNKKCSPPSSPCVDRSQRVVVTNLERINKHSWNNNEDNEQQRAHETGLKVAEKDATKCSATCDGERTRRNALKSVVRSESCPSGAPSYSKERVVGKVSSAIDAKAQKLAVLYETDHRPNAPPCVVRKDFPPGLGGSDICHFCSKRVYVMERLSADGYFFHRECFRCDVCNCTLRLGGHTFDSQEGKFYCKMHYPQRQNSTNWGRLRRTTEDLSLLKPSSLDSRICSTTGSVQPPVRPTKEGDAVARGQMQDGAKGHSNTKHNNRWRRKIRATFPLMFIKHSRSRPATVPEVDSDFEEVTSTETQIVAKKADAHNLSEESKRSDKPSAAVKPVSSTSAPKKRLLVSQDEKHRLLNWEECLSPEESPINSSTTNTPKHKNKVQADADKPQTNSSQIGTAGQGQTSASSSSAIQVIANAFRRTFSGSSQPSSSRSAVLMRAKRDFSRKRRPMSEGAFSFGSLFSPVEPTTPERRTSLHAVQWASVGTDPWGEGQDLPSLLQQVSLKSRKDSAEVSDELSSPSCKRVDLFSSLRLRKRGLSESEGKEQEAQKEIRTFLSNLRNKASSQQSLEDLSSSDDESEKLTSNKLSSERLRKKQEKTAAQQAKREQLKRLHRAQVIQRQLEEVEEKQRDLEERGVTIEKIIRGEDSPQTEDRDEAQLYQAWFQLVLEKNRLARYESELMIFAQELALEDTQSRLQQDLRRRMAIEDTDKSASELQEEKVILAELMRTVEKRDMLVSILDEQRLKERAEDKDLESLVLSRGYEFHWAEGSNIWGAGEA
ncbi:protein-methionine sulfoxide oxidase mical2b isoform X2 [Fundulus heteroclitus]|uniref:protein-methionine sulfoxide oxidase mical2b isoform X2 n=1 Tax=Fundulus heteroclitus TaxID=8078 RepID=UPI00165C78A7|nr:protein-methionine sulfoxide oxidase mical2b isoform X2 [Fundulus heteroclitus]